MELPCDGVDRPAQCPLPVYPRYWPTNYLPSDHNDDLSSVSVSVRSIVNVAIWVRIRTQNGRSSADGAAHARENVKGYEFVLKPHVMGLTVSPLKSPSTGD